MAHLSGDPDLLGVFADGGDVFRAIAAALQGGGKMAAHITDDERRQVKRPYLSSILSPRAAARIGGDVANVEDVVVCHEEACLRRQIPSPAPMVLRTVSLPSLFVCIIMPYSSSVSDFSVFFSGSFTLELR